MRLLVLAGLGLGLFSPAAYAQDEESPFQDLLDDEDDSFGQNTPAPQPPSPKPTEAPEPELDFEDAPEGDAPDLLEEDPNAGPNVSGDTADTFRKTLDQTREMDVDDALQTWEEYLQRYPLTPFRAQIEAEMASLEERLYDAARPGANKPPEEVDNQDKQLGFSQALLLESINPRQRFHVLIEYGLPDWGNLGIGYEHAFAKNFSALVQARQRYGGYGLEVGARWALVKSLRTKTLVTLLADARINVSPVAYFGLRPQLAFGKSFGNLDIQAQGGAEFAPRTSINSAEEKTTRLVIVGVGGLHMTYRAADVIGIFAETSLAIKNQSGAAGPFRFNQVAVGLRFYPVRKAKKPDNYEINLGASLPYTSAYWQMHYGAVVGMANIFLD